MLIEGAFLRNFSRLLILACLPAAAATLPLVPCPRMRSREHGRICQLGPCPCVTVILPIRTRAVGRRGFDLIPNAKFYSRILLSPVPDSLGPCSDDPWYGSQAS
ncbi:hypothetical protein ASPVEDRAFT_353846 [Aspergillus versicolor CBS 583.65]|uniref:Secreted protein n=1 Tax=Aspergillus versicolor CBS 583.65 TaxID=1036611 RepID=A0A1L9PZT7_ASPVE|nr:uncharacterized protein ASPVEDRAFT_353846 [Aspergillus versicolor CBS 583.65]OJJ07041.1 hypothetical protein ASPVEDRAFT_353846 [Aspergillus versicolor CBS 583.65]